MKLMMGYPPIYVIGVVAVLLSILAFSRNDRVWGTIIKLFNVFFATMFAINFFEPMANMLDGCVVKFAYYNDMLSFFFIFGITLEILVEITNRISKIDVAFSHKTNVIGNYVVLFILFIGFYGVTMFMFMTTMPEAPRLETTTYKRPMVVTLLPHISKTSLRPFSANAKPLNMNDFLQRQNLRNCGVYAHVASSESSWQFAGQTSPNGKEGTGAGSLPAPKPADAAAPAPESKPADTPAPPADK